MKNFNVKQSGSEVILEEVNPYDEYNKNTQLGEWYPNPNYLEFEEHKLILTNIDPQIKVGQVIREDQLEPDLWQWYDGGDEIWREDIDHAYTIEEGICETRQVAKLKQVDNESCWHCKVPNHLHNTCCGWPNATLIMYPQNYQESEWNIKWHEANPGISFVGQCNCANRKVPAGGIHGCNICNSSAFTVAVSLPNTPVTLPNAKPFTVALIHDLLKQVSEGDISYSRMVEIMNERANSCHTNETVQVDRVETPIQEEETFIETINGVKYLCTRNVKEGDEVLSDPQAAKNYERGLIFKLVKIHAHVYDDSPDRTYYFADLLYQEHPLMPELIGRVFKNWPLENCFKIIEPVQEHKPESEENDHWGEINRIAAEVIREHGKFLIFHFRKKCIEQGFEITKKK